jgi:hypothetical protein
MEGICDAVSEKGREAQRIENKNMTIGNRKASRTFMDRDLYFSRIYYIINTSH